MNMRACIQLAELAWCVMTCGARMQPDELAKICEVMGSPGGEVWPEGQRLAAAMGFSFPQAQQQVHRNRGKGVVRTWQHAACT